MEETDIFSVMNTVLSTMRRYSLLHLFSDNLPTIKIAQISSSNNLVYAILRAHERINSQSLGVEAPAWQGAKVQEYLDIPSFRKAARRDASADKM